jgi:hypothetical protein
MSSSMNQYSEAARVVLLAIVFSQRRLIIQVHLCILCNCNKILSNNSTSGCLCIYIWRHLTTHLITTLADFVFVVQSCCYCHPWQTRFCRVYYLRLKELYILSRFRVGAWIIRRVLDRVIGFIDILYTQLGTTGNYGAIAYLHTLHFTVTHALGFSVITSRILITDL